VYGQHFDILRPGVHVLLQVPRGAEPNATKLRVQAQAVQMGASCAEMYFQVLNVTGQWVEDGLRPGGPYAAAGAPGAVPGPGGQGGLHFSTESAGELRQTPWMSFGGVGLKVVWGHTSRGVKYLNVLLKHVGQAGFTVGGLLGVDDHSWAASRSASCMRPVALGKVGIAAREGPASAEHAPVVLEASVATWE